MSISLSTRLFNPITGSELRQTIINEFTRALENSQLLQPHLTFDLAKYEIKLHLESYPMNDALDITVGRQISSGHDPEGVVQLEDLAVRKEIGETQDTAPDKVREDNDLPVPTRTRDEKTGQLVDVLREKSVTVGAGTRPRARIKKQETKPVDTGGVEIKANLSA